MRQAIRALSIATKILWLIVIIFSATVVYSAVNLGMGFGNPETYLTGSSMSLSTPVFVNNTGFYEITNLNITTRIESRNNETLSKSTTIIPRISPNSNVHAIHNLTLDLRNLTRDFPYLAFNDSIFDAQTFLKLKFVDVIPIQISANTTISWGAPLHNFSIGEITFNHVQSMLIIPIRFENHAGFSVSGTMCLEAYNSDNEQINRAEISVNMPSGTGFEDSLELNVDPLKMTREGQIRINFATYAFDTGPIIKNWMI